MIHISKRIVVDGIDSIDKRINRNEILNNNSNNKNTIDVSDGKKKEETRGTALRLIKNPIPACRAV